MDKAIPFQDIPWWASSDQRLPEYVAASLGFYRSPDHGLLEWNFWDFRDDIIQENASK